MVSVLGDLQRRLGKEPTLEWTACLSPWTRWLASGPSPSWSWYLYLVTLSRGWCESTYNFQKYILPTHHFYIRSSLVRELPVNLSSLFKLIASFNVKDYQLLRQHYKALHFPVLNNITKPRILFICNLKSKLKSQKGLLIHERLYSMLTYLVISYADFIFPRSEHQYTSSIEGDHRRRRNTCVFQGSTLQHCGQISRRFSGPCVTSIQAQRQRADAIHTKNFPQ